jgi:hypothetical protein
MLKITNNIIAFFLALISSFFLLISGTTGVSSWIEIEDLILKYANFFLINEIFIIIFIIASFGGLAVLLGGFLILRNKNVFGNLFITLGTGAGIITFSFSLFLSIISNDFSLFSYFSLSSLGIIFALSAQFFSNKEKIILWIQKIKKYIKVKN